MNTNELTQDDLNKLKATGAGSPELLKSLERARWEAQCRNAEKTMSAKDGQVVRVYKTS